MSEEQAKVPETFSREYVTELREENKTHRLKNQEAETHKQAALKEAEEAKAALKKRDEEVEAFKAETKTSADQRVIRAELKAEAVKAGMIDLDGLKLADLSTITLDDKGDVVGAEALFKALKESKPYLFKAVSTSSTDRTPDLKDPAPTKAIKCTLESV